MKMNGNNRHFSILTECKWLQCLNEKISNSKQGLKKQDPIICCLQEIHLTEKNKHWLRVKRYKKIFQENRPHKQAGVAILISDKIDFRLKSVRRDNKRLLLINKGTIHQE
jgi:exonuclease III